MANQGWHYFSESYEEARERILTAASLSGANTRSYAVCEHDGKPLHLDVIDTGPSDAPCVVLSSGIHGVEGFLGSAVQLRVLEAVASGEAPAGVRYLVLHAMNPYGFSRVRRTNEDNVDLNRNFLLPDETFDGAPDGYAALSPLLNPEHGPSRFDLFLPKIAATIARTGLQALRGAVAGGQYDYPAGLFYGGSSWSSTAKIVFEHFESWLADAPSASHIDYHTGLGPWADYKMLVTDAPGSASFGTLCDTFGEAKVESLTSDSETAYEVSGFLGNWTLDRFAARDYRFAAAEFGTYHSVRVLRAMRRENMAHHHSQPDAPEYARAKADLMEVFCPADSGWRDQTVDSGYRLVEQAAAAL